MALSGNGLYLAVGGTDDNTNRGAAWIFQASPYARCTYLIQVAPEADEGELQQALERNIDEILLAAVTRTLWSVGSLELRCDQSKPLRIIYFTASQGLSSTQIKSILDSASKTDLFGNYSGDVCAYTLEGVEIIFRTSEAPSPAPRNQPKCLKSCRMEYNYDKYACRDKFIIPEIACKIMARITKFKCIREAVLESFCFF